MSACTHDLAERETACADGYCPMCLVADLDAARALLREIANGRVGAGGALAYFAEQEPRT